jgi:filamentous hemagglutinin
LSEQALTLRIAHALENAKGLVSATSLDARAGHFSNQSGTLSARDGLNLSVDGLLDNRSGKLLANELSLTAGALDNSSGEAQGDRSLTIRSGALINQNGTLAAGNTFALTAANMDNTDGKLTSNGALTAAIAGNLLNQAGVLAATGNLSLSLGSLDNQRQGRISSKADLTLAGGALDNRNGSLGAVGVLKLNAAILDNTKDLLRVGGVWLDNSSGQVAANRIDLGLSGQLSNRSGIIESDTVLNVRANSLDNQGGQLRAMGNSGKTDFQVGGVFDNRKLMKARRLGGPLRNCRVRSVHAHRRVWPGG